MVCLTNIVVGHCTGRQPSKPILIQAVIRVCVWQKQQSQQKSTLVMMRIQGPTRWPPFPWFWHSLVATCCGGEWGGTRSRLAPTCTQKWWGLLVPLPHQNCYSATSHKAWASAQTALLGCRHYIHAINHAFNHALHSCIQLSHTCIQLSHMCLLLESGMCSPEQQVLFWHSVTGDDMCLHSTTLSTTM